MTRVTSTKPGLWGRLKRLATTDVGALLRKLNAEDLERIEQLLLEADFGVPATMELVAGLESGVRSGKLKNEGDLRAAFEGATHAHHPDEHDEDDATPPWMADPRLGA